VSEIGDCTQIKTVASFFRSSPPISCMFFICYRSVGCLLRSRSLLSRCLQEYSCPSKEATTLQKQQLINTKSIHNRRGSETRSTLWDVLRPVVWTSSHNAEQHDFPVPDPFQFSRYALSFISWKMNTLASYSYLDCYSTLHTHTHTSNIKGNC